MLKSSKRSIQSLRKRYELLYVTGGGGSPPVAGNFIVLETGDRMLQENGDGILQES